MKIHKYTALSILLFLSVICFSTTDSFAQDNQPGNSVKADKAPTDFDPKYEKIKSRVSYVPGIKVIRGETHVIVPEQDFFCPAGSVFKFNNGDIQVYDQRSSDGGKTWYQVGYVLDNSTYQFPEPDGEVVMFLSLTSAGASSSVAKRELSLRETNQKGVFEANIFCSKDNGLSRESDTSKIYLPEKFSGWSVALCRKIVGLDDGSLLMSMYLRSEKKNSIENKFRSIAIRSTDRGKTWNYLSTIAFDMDEEIRGEGFDETSLLVYNGDTIFSFMRSGASYQASLGSFNNNDRSNKMPFGYAKQTPIYKSISVDGGKNWSCPDPITSYGVWPDAILMENGITALTYGRPGNWIMFNDNKSQNWGPIIPFYNDLYPPDCGNYFSIAEVAPNILLVVYSRTNPNDYWKSELVGTYFNVRSVVE